MEVLSIFTTLFSLIFFGGTSTVIPPAPTEIAPSETIVSTSVTEPTEVTTDINVEILAQCLSKKGAVMYGAFWCPHCQAQKKLFGDDFQFITYQECDAKGPGGNPQVCKSQGITGYPTWKFPSHEDLVGEQTFTALAEAANCPIN